jgi:hypothetical protein
MIQDVHTGSGSRIRILVIYPSRIPDPGVKKAPDLGSGMGKKPGSWIRIRDGQPGSYFIELNHFFGLK